MASPIAFSTGLIWGCFLGLLTPATHVLLSEWNVADALNAISKSVVIFILHVSCISLNFFTRFQITDTFLTPSRLHQVVHYPGIMKMDLSSLKTIAVGSSHFPPELAAQAAAALPPQTALAECMSSCYNFVVCSFNPVDRLRSNRSGNILASTYLKQT